ncbi:hypothetical protein OH77DRAFT_1440697, partial [Trametes cingulata]
EEFLKFQAEQEHLAAQQIEVWMRYLKKDSRSGEIKLAWTLDAIAKEHGDVYIDGIQPVFDPLKARHFDSSWNWVLQDSLLMCYDITFGRLSTVDRRCIAIMNRADPELVTYMQYYIGQQLIGNCKEVASHRCTKTSRSLPLEDFANGDQIVADVLKLWNVVKSQPEITSSTWRLSWTTSTIVHSDLRAPDALQNDVPEGVLDTRNYY